jgi:hypothetical protein
MFFKMIQRVFFNLREDLKNKKMCGGGGGSPLNF